MWQWENGEKHMNSGAIPIIEMKGITKTFGTIEALKDIYFSINRNEIIGLVGDNGAGKSTLINILSGIFPPTKGKIFAEGKEVAIRSYKDSTRIGIETIYQDSALVDQMDASRNIFLGREIQLPLGFMNTRRMDALTMEILNSIGISGISSPKRLVENLSGGQKQSVSIARAVHFKSKILLLDEPTAALSVKEAQFVNNLITKLKEDDISCVYVTHNIHVAYQVSDRFFILSHGKKVADVRKEDTSVDQVTQIILSN
jgi:simple sugar transport system ATP-binding protein